MNDMRELEPDARTSADSLRLVGENIARTVSGVLTHPEH
jgi:hypothetical protein